MGVARPSPGVSSATLTAAGWAVGLIVTALVLWTPLLVSGYRDPSADLVLDSIDACVALLVAYLVYGRFVRQRRLQDLLLANGLVLLAVPGLGLSYAAEALSGTFVSGTLDVWLPLTIRVMGAVLIAAAALAGLGGAGRVIGAHTSVVVPVAVTVVVALVCVVLWGARLHLPVALDHDYVPSSAQLGAVTGYLLLPIAHGVAAVCFFVASIAFAAQAARRCDALLRWLGPACALAGFARLHYMMFPSLYTDWLYTGDLLRTGCYVLLLAGAARELRQYWMSQSRDAVVDDRRRLARELHDGVIQELSYIRSESHSIPADAAAGVTTAELTAAHIIAACDRALDETRAAVQALGRAGEEPLGFMLHRTAREMAERYAVHLEVDLDDSISASQDQKHALMRIAREAVSNAVHHGKAERVVVCLGQGEGKRHLTIQDDGRGFDVAAAVAKNVGYGLVSMRERARALPGSFDVEATTGRGSVVTVTW
jgi:signal transduction histidine kinase